MWSVWCGFESSLNPAGAELPLSFLLHALLRVEGGLLWGVGSGCGWFWGGGVAEQGVGCDVGAAAEEVGRLQDGLGMFTGLHAQRRHASCAVALATVWRQEGQAHGVRNAAGAERPS